MHDFLSKIIELMATPIKSIDKELSELELPEDEITIDQIENMVGLAKGKLSNSETATELAKSS